ncbi:MAG: hypothetical protein AABX69_03740, partial [Nanoarchaeota archaeon]
MKRTILTALPAFAFGIGLALLAATPSMAVHKGSGDLTCGACHTMHSSQGGGSGTSMGQEAGGSFILLRTSVATRADLHNFCLQCHSQDGAQASVQNNAGSAATTPPKVHLTTQWDGTNFGNVGGGGAFNGTYVPGLYSPDTVDDPGQVGTTALGKQHSIGASSGTASPSKPPGNSFNSGSSIGTTITALSCTSCHDPHGTAVTTDNINKYRNLKAGTAMAANTGVQNTWTDMAAFGDLATSYVGGVTNTGSGANNSLGITPTGASGIGAGVFDNIWPVINTGS